MQINKEKIKSVFQLLKCSITEFLDDKCLKLSASLSYSTIFALPSLAILIISSVGLFYDEKMVTTEFFEQIADLLGEKAAIQVQNAIQNINVDGSSRIGQWVGILLVALVKQLIPALLQHYTSTLPFATPTTSSLKSSP